MMDELRHRVKNILAVVQGMSWQIAKRSANLESYQEAFNERLVTLARTHDILVKRNWTAVSLLDLIAAHIGAFNNAGELSVAGEVTFLEPVAAEQLGLALYELASNCIKYGAWKQAGNVSIEWSVTDHGFLELRWMERGAREKSDNERQGFGKLILTTVIPEALSGTANWRENDDGILWQVSIHPKFFRFQDASARAIADGLVPVEATIPTDVLDRRKTSP